MAKTHFTMAMGGQARVEVLTGSNISKRAVDLDPDSPDAHYCWPSGRAGRRRYCSEFVYGSTHGGTLRAS